VTRRFPGPAPAGDLRGAELATWLAGAYPFARRTLISAEPPEKVQMAELASLGWEIATAEDVARRTFHYDAVVWRGSEAKSQFGRLIEESHSATVSILDLDDQPETDAALTQALAAAGIPLDPAPYALSSEDAF